THAVFNNAMKQAVRWRLVNSNPCDHVDLPQLKRKEMKALDRDQAGRFLAAAKESEFYALFALLLTTGMRPGEAIALRWCDIDLASGAVSITRALSGRSGDYRFEEPKTPKSRRTLPIPLSVTDSLRTLKSARQKAADGVLIDLQLVFVSSNGSLIDLQNLNKRHFKPILKAASLSPEIRLYDLRHSCATLLLQAGTHVKVVSERLGHASAMLTLDRYSHVVPGLQESATEKLESMLFGEHG
ncbi:MAG TPA: site-specific integrase, partial [Chthoniobacteraceae bacterium]|nr:site-specific integrase [Chthoniobacteraceae bacterium]